MEYILQLFVLLLGTYWVVCDKPLRCFKCSFDLRNGQCDDPFHVTGIEVTSNCTGSCVKVKIYTDKQDHVYGRYCSPKKEEDGCRVINTGADKKMEDCYCNTDLCNNARSNLSSVVSIVSLIFILTMFK